MKILRNLTVIATAGLVLFTMVPWTLQLRDNRAVYWSLVRGAQHVLGFSDEFSSRNLSQD